MTEIERLSDLTARELDLLASDAVRWAHAATAIGDEEIADTFRARARAFKGLAAREEDEQSRFEAGKGITLRREDVTLDDVERVMSEAHVAAKERQDGVEVLAFGIALDFLRDVYGEDEPPTTELEPQHG